MIADVANNLLAILVWAVVATAAMTIILQGSQILGWSRLSLPFMFGTFVTDNRPRANIFGFFFYLLGGMIIAVFYYLLFHVLGTASWWLGAIFGLGHGLFFLIAVVPLFPYIHPHMASEYDGPTSTRRLEPPGFLALNYGQRTPLTTLVGQLVYGAILGFGYGPLV